MAIFNPEKKLIWYKLKTCDFSVVNAFYQAVVPEWTLNPSLAGTGDMVLSLPTTAA